MSEGNDYIVVLGQYPEIGADEQGMPIQPHVALACEIADDRLEKDVDYEQLVRDGDIVIYRPMEDATYGELLARHQRGDNIRVLVTEPRVGVPILNEIKERGEIPLPETIVLYYTALEYSESQLPGIRAWESSPNVRIVHGAVQNPADKGGEILLDTQAITATLADVIVEHELEKGNALAI